ncbi:MAG TPA: cytochrome c biogenesis protein CcdA, partial [Candidatus Limnocylindrales bacterium]
LTMAATSGTVRQGALLLVAYTIGLGLPFLLIAAVYDRAPRLMAPLVRHGRTVSLIGGLLVVFIGVAMVFDWLALLPRYFNFPGV